MKRDIWVVAVCGTSVLVLSLASLIGITSLDQPDHFHCKKIERVFGGHALERCELQDYTCFVAGGVGVWCEPKGAQK